MLQPYEHSEVWTEIDKAIGKLAKATQSTYRKDFERFLRWGGHEFYSQEGARWIVKCDSCVVEAYHEWLKSLPGDPTRRDLKAGDVVVVEGLASSTICRYLSSLTRIFNRLAHKGVIDKNPVSLKELAPECAGRRMKRPTEYLSKEEVKAIFDLTLGSEVIALRDKAYLSILFGGGLRLKECVSLKVEDFTQIGEMGTTPCMGLRIKASKGKPDDYAPLPMWAVRHIEEYLKYRSRIGNISPQDPLLSAYATGTKAWTPNGAYRRFKTFARMIGKPNAHPHSARKSAITSFYDSTKDIILTQTYARHTSISTTQRYIATTKGKVSAALG